MTVHVIVDRFIRLRNRWPIYELAIAGCTALAIAAHFAPGTDVSVAGGFMLASIGTAPDDETREKHCARFWSAYNKARHERGSAR